MKFKPSVCFLASALLLAAACSAAEDDPRIHMPQGEAEEPASDVWKLKFKGNAGTRTSFGEYVEGSPLPLKWLRGDGIGLFLSREESAVEGGQNLIAVLDKSSGGLSGGVFTAEVTSLEPSAYYDAKLYYPWRYLAGDGAVITGRVAPHQLQKAAGSSAHIGKSGGFAVATTGFSTPASGKTVSDIAFELNHKTAYVWFDVKAASGNYFGWTLKRISLSAPDGVFIAGATSYDTSSGAFTLNDAVSRSSSIVLDIEKGEPLSATAQSAYMVVFPTAVAAETLTLSYTLTNPSGTSTVTLSHDKAIGASSGMFAAGKAYHLVEEIPATSGSGWTETPYSVDVESCRAEVLSVLKRANLPSISLTYQDNLTKVSLSVVNDEFYAAQGRVSEGNLIDSNSIYEAASVSKVPFAYVAMKMYDDGELDLDKPLYEYWPEMLDLFAEDARENAKLITARLCLLHTTGLPNGGLTPPISFTASKLPVGSQIQYSGTALCVLAKVIEQMKGGIDFAQIAKAYIFDKLGMNTSTYLYSDYSDSYSTLHTYGYPNHTRHTSWTTGVHATLRTNSLQFNEFLQWFLHGADLTPEGYEEMMRDYVRYNANNIRTLGWFVEHNEELGSIFWHNGINGGGFRSWAFLLPERGITLCWFVNATYSYNIQAPLFNIFVGNKTAVGTLGGMTPLPSDKVGDSGSSPISYE